MDINNSFYDRLRIYKAQNKVGYKDMGEVLDMTDATIRMALKRESLSELQKNRLQEVFNLKPSYNNSSTLSQFTPLEIVEYIYENEEEFLKLATFQRLLKK
ncbi:hypothetical protein [Sediminicola sp. 1XM1-17]|uniref:hypothetical protein n=1 Tax=Sediminicola sp. 1XM1-17 TaxID=3127702 RepID=UPI003077705A